jgi:pilus assembly protein CpaB
LTPVQKNEPILASRITGSGQRASLSALIDPGMRAVTLRVDDVRGVAGFVLPGDRVDVVLTRHEAGDKAYADVLLQNAKVLAVDQLANERQEGPSVAKAVTVEVSTEQAQKLVLAAGVGSLSLVLRQAGGADPVASRRVSTFDLAQGEYAGLDQDKANLLQQKISALEAKMDSELKRLSTPPAATADYQPAGESQSSMVRIIRGVKAEDYSVNRQAH